MEKLKRFVTKILAQPEARPRINNDQFSIFNEFLNLLIFKLGFIWKLEIENCKFLKKR